MRILDLFCGAGGASVGFHRAGFKRIVGVDIKPQKRYPFEFVQMDALEYLALYGHLFDLIAASPPCQKFSATQPIQNNDHPDFLTPTRNFLLEIGRPYIIENVPGAPLINPLMLCGTMFGLGVIRHRLFEIWPKTIWFPPASCNHNGRATGANTSTRRGGTKNPGFQDGFKFITVSGHSFLADDARKAMGIDWMTRDELAQAIPPAYTEWIGRRILEA
jgi:DNA (cytosine-5)-methyltransferase 1